MTHKIDLDKIAEHVLSEHIQEIAACFGDVMSDPNPASYLHALIAAATIDILSSEVIRQDAIPDASDAASLNRILLGLLLARAQRPLTLLRP